MKNPCEGHLTYISYFINLVLAILGLFLVIQGSSLLRYNNR